MSKAFMLVLLGMSLTGCASLWHQPPGCDGKYHRINPAVMYQPINANRYPKIVKNTLADLSAAQGNATTTQSEVSNDE